MKVKFLENLLSQVASVSHKVRDYFNNGSFGIAIYPYLMHPCVRKSLTGLMLLVAVLSAFGGVFYLFGEHVAILFSERSITAYVHHSTLELFFPIGAMVDGKESVLATMPQVMRAVFEYQAYMFIPFYFLGVYRMSNKHYWILSGFLAICFAIGCLLVSGITTGHYTEGGLHNLGLGITIIIGNLVLLVSGLDIPKSYLAKFKYYSLLLGFIGLGCLIFTMIVPSVFSPILERISIYTIMIWEILAGFALLKCRSLKHV